MFEQAAIDKDEILDNYLKARRERMQYPNSFFSSYASRKEFRDNVKAVVVKPLVGTQMVLAHAVQCVSQACITVLDLALLDFQSAKKDLGQTIGHALLVTYHALTSALDTLMTAFRAFTHSFMSGLALVGLAEQTEEKEVPSHHRRQDTEFTGEEMDLDFGADGQLTEEQRQAMRMQ